VAGYYHNTAIITDFIYALIPSCQFEDTFSPFIALKSSNKISMWYEGNWSDTCLVSSLLSTVETSTFRTL